MKSKIVLLLLLTYSFSILSAQIPQGFNYQAIARDGSNNIISNYLLPVRITLQTASTGGTVIWQETQSVTTNQFGLLGLVVGKGTRTGGTATLFSDINWGAQPVYLKTEIQYPATGYIDMGTTQLWSVPYSITAKDLVGPVPRFGVTGTTMNLEEALFEVKNNTGQTVFAVYNEGVRVYVDDGAKGSKGGFAIGGFGNAKGPSQKLFMVKKDSIKMFIDDTPGKGSKGGFAIGGFSNAKGESNFFNVNTDAAALINPSENRVLWYPTKNAFLVGKVLIEHPDSVGFNSFASGYESKAIGNYSEAFGYQSKAQGSFSTAMGYNSSAKGDYSVALGYNSIAKGNFSFAVGINTQATGLNSFALGYNSKATGTLTYAIGYKNTAMNSVASGGPMYAFGDETLVDHWGATTFGWQTKSQAAHATAMGDHTTATAYASLIIGRYNVISGSPNSWSSGDPVFVIGNGSSYGAPANAFTVLNNGNTTIQVSGTDGYSGLGIKSTLTGGKLITINQGTAGKLNFTTPGVTDLVTMDFNTNRVGILRSPTSYALEVGGTIWANGSAISAGSSTWSDSRYKKDVTPIADALSDVLQMEGVRYNWRQSDFPELNFPKGEQIGVIAQDLEKIVPELVITNADGYKSVSYEKLTPILIEAIKAQQKEIDILKNEVELLKAKR
jgi:hypothetical protein